MGVSSASPHIFLQCLERLEADAQEMIDRDELVRFFCERVVPFLAESDVISDLRSDWQQKYIQMNEAIDDLQKRATTEVLASLQELKGSLCKSKEAKIRQQLLHLDEITKREDPPRYETLYYELKNLLFLALQAGYVDLCKRYALLASRKVYVGNQLSDELYIDTFVFAPSVTLVCNAIESSHSARLHDPAIVWGYFESAMWCWRTPRMYFEQPTKKDQPISFQVLCNMSAWMEIAVTRERLELRSPVVIFTNDLFQRGLSVIINAIGMFLAGAPVRAIATTREPEVTFTLVLDGNELWVHATFENRATEKFFIQAFHECGDGEGSALFKFVKSIFTTSQRGERRARLPAKWETASKHINRLKLPEDLKQAFFERKAHGSTYYLAGTQVRIKNPGGVMHELAERREILE